MRKYFTELKFKLRERLFHRYPRMGYVHALTHQETIRIMHWPNLVRLCSISPQMEKLDGNFAHIVLLDFCSDDAKEYFSQFGLFQFQKQKGVLNLSTMGYEIRFCNESDYLIMQLTFPDFLDGRPILNN